VGSGYRVDPEAVLTAAHVVAALPVWRAGEPVPAEVDAPGVCWTRPLGDQEWVPAVVAWRDEAKDVAVLRLAQAAPPLPPGSPPPRWGRVAGMESVAVSAVGFPWAQERPDRVRDSEQLFGFIAPAAMAKAGLFAVTVLTAAPAGRAGGSPWAGMSGAALFTGPFLVGVAVVDPARFGADRVVAAPVAPLLSDARLAGLLGTSAEHVVEVGPRLRLAVTAETSVALAPPYRAPTPRLGREQARLLLPEYGIVPFAGRSSDLELLEAWCLAGTAPALRLVIGSGGAGKTRLVAEACVRMVGRGWQAGFADLKSPGGQARLEFDRPTLLAVDDADLNVPLLAGLIRVLAYQPDGAPPIRLLLLARHTTGWWETLNQDTNRLAAELEDMALMLGDGELSLTDRGEHYARALAAFAVHLDDGVSPAGQEPPLLADPAFASPLLVHMHALLTASGARVPTTGDAIRESILDAVLGRERLRWKATFPISVPTGGDLTHQQAVTVATLLAPPTGIAARHAMTIIDEFAPDAAAGARAAVATWLRELYPGSDPPWVAPLRPDLLAEQLLATCDQLSELVLAGYASLTVPEQAEQILTEITRAGSRPSVRGALDRLLSEHLSNLLTAAIDAPAGQLPDLLDYALQLAPQPALAGQLADQVPDHSVRLAALAATLARQQVTHYRRRTIDEGQDTAGRLAGSLSNLSSRLADLGRPEDALEAIGEAVRIYRELIAAGSDAFKSDLARSLTIQSNDLTALGRQEDALTAVNEAVKIYHRLVTVGSHAFEPDLAQSLTIQANNLAAVGQLREALASFNEAGKIYRRLAAAGYDVSEDLAKMLSDRSGVLVSLNRIRDALPSIKKAVEIYQRLAEARPDAFEPDLAKVLNNESNMLVALGRAQEALARVNRSVEIYQRLAEARPDAFESLLVLILSNQSAVLVAAGRPQDAMEAAHDSVQRMIARLERRLNEISDYREQIIRNYEKCCKMADMPPDRVLLIRYERLRQVAPVARAMNRSGEQTAHQTLT
jgi:tetratricopeptide (TPR) repeat protein